MHRLLERLDGAASTIVPVAYLTGLLLGTMSYFAGITLNAGLAVGVALALAAELHSFLEQRRCRALWAAHSRASEPDARDRLAGQLKEHMAILAALVMFSAVNATAFAAETWHPAPGFLPTWLQIGLRGAVVPCLFLLTGALSPLTTSASDELAAASRHMLHRTIRATVKQWNARIERACKRGVDLAPVAVSLMLDAGDTDGARRVRLIAQGLSVAETGTNSLLMPGIQTSAPESMVDHPTALYDVSQPPATAKTTPEPPTPKDATSAPIPPVEPPADEDPPDTFTPPTSQDRPPGARTGQRGVHMPTSDRRNDPAVLKLAGVRKLRRDFNQTDTGRTHGQHVRTSNASREDDARAAWLAGARTVTAMQQALECSRATAAKHVRYLKAETTARMAR